MKVPIKNVAGAIITTGPSECKVATAMTALFALGFITCSFTPACAQNVIPSFSPPAKTQAGRAPEESVLTPPPSDVPVAPKGAPNIVLIMTDDVGYGASSTFGGPIPTPTMDALAKNGLRYTEFHTVGICSPTRAALLTGRNHNVVQMGNVEEQKQDVDGYTGVIPKSAGNIAEVLREHGYNTAAFGKWHLVPGAEKGPTGPFNRWPTGVGFEYFYGFLGGQTNEWAPELYENTTPTEPPHDGSYHLDNGMADHAISWIRQQKAVAPDKPFFIYYAPGAAHAPHHAPKDWIAKFKGKFDQGWDKVREETLARQKQMGVVPANTQLTPRYYEIPAWDSLPPERKEVYARMMEVYAAYLSHADDQIGRVVNTIRDMGQMDNTLFVYIQGDNGASAEGTSQQGEYEETSWFNNVPEDFDYIRAHMDELGGPKAENHYPIGWASAMNTPFSYFKQIASHFGGTRNGMVMSWNGHIRSVNAVRTQFHHVIDIVPTILDVARIDPPAMMDGVPQLPLDGVSMTYSFDHADAASQRHVQYFNMIDNMAIYKDGWVAATTPDLMPWKGFTQGTILPIADRKWELYHIADDYSESVDLAQKEPKKLQELEALFWAEAGRNNALPISPVLALHKFADTRPRTDFTYTSEIVDLPFSVAPNVRNRSFSIAADVTIPESGGDGMLVTDGGRFCGYGFYVQGGKLNFVYNYLGRQITTVTSPAVLGAGDHKLAVNFAYDGGGKAKGGMASLVVDGKQVAQARVPETVAVLFSGDEGFNVGVDTGTPVVDTYALPFRFAGALHKVTVTLK